MGKAAQAADSSDSLAARNIHDLSSRRVVGIAAKAKGLAKIRWLLYSHLPTRSRAVRNPTKRRVYGEERVHNVGSTSGRVCHAFWTVHTYNSMVHHTLPRQEKATHN